MRIVRHRLRVSIRTQLIALVMFVSMFSLLVLAVVCGVYFTNVFTDARIAKLQVAVELKSVQMQQAFESFSYQIQQLSAKTEIEKALSARKAGNTSEATLDAAKSMMYQTMQNTNGLVDAKLYDLNFETVADTSNPNARINASETMMNALYILDSGGLTNGTLPDGLLANGGYLEGPYMQNETYFMSMTVAVYANESILIPQSFVTGYLTVIIDAKTLADVSVKTNTSDYSAVHFFIPVSTLTNATDLTGFLYAFLDTSMTQVEYNNQYEFSEFKPAEAVFLQGKSLGQETKIRNPLKQMVSLGYSEVNLGVAKWLVTVEQTRSLFVAPTTKLIKIMVGMCIGLAFFMCVVTFPLAHYGVRPILELQKATESITERRGIKKGKGRRKRLSKSTGIFNPFHRERYSEKSPEEAMSDHEDSQQGGLRMETLPPYSTATSPSNSVTRNSWAASSPSMPSSNDSFVDTSLADLESPPVSTSLVETNGIFYDELTELTDAFNAMTLELEKQYTHLEDRVRARTKELEAAKVQADAARQQAEDANEAKTVFIANISHELRTPLNGILGMTSVAMTEEDPQKIQSSLDLIFRSGELLLHILTQLLTFSKNQLDKSKLQKKNFLMIDVALQIYSIFGKTAKDRDVKLIITLKPNFIRDVILFGDSNRIIQVVMNLVSNSLKFTPKDGTVRVLVEVLGEYDEDRSKEENYERVYIRGMDEDTDMRPVTPISKEIKTIEDVFRDADDSPDDMSIATLESSEYHTLLNEFVKDAHPEDTMFNSEEGFYEGDLSNLDGNRQSFKSKKFTKGAKQWVLRLSVSDTGTGIDPSLQDKIFDAFVQGDQTLSRSHGGTGLGLSICKQFAKMMHGTITLNSAIGEGSTFTFTIPLPQVGELDSSARDTNDRYNETYMHKRVKFATGVDDEDILDPSDAATTHSPMNLAKSYAANSSPSHNHTALLTFDKPDLITRASTGTATSYKSSAKSSRASINTDIPEATISEEGAVTPVSVVTPTPTIKSRNSLLRILVAEDNLVNQEVVKRMLLFEGVQEITLARDGNDAISFVQESMEKQLPFDLILMDVQMPNLDGLSATRIIRQELHYEGPIVALTAFADQSNQDTCIEAGMTGFLSKPIRRSLLRNVLRDF